MLVFIAPPDGLEPAVLRRDGRREVWARVCLLGPATDCVDGQLLDARWWAFACGEEVMSPGTMKFVVQGLHHNGSHSGMS